MKVYLIFTFSICMVLIQTFGIANAEEGFLSDDNEKITKKRVLTEEEHSCVLKSVSLAFDLIRKYKIVSIEHQGCIPICDGDEIVVHLAERIEKLRERGVDIFIEPHEGKCEISSSHTTLDRITIFEDLTYDIAEKLFEFVHAQSHEIIRKHKLEFIGTRKDSIDYGKTMPTNTQYIVIVRPTFRTEGSPYNERQVFLRIDNNRIIVVGHRDSYLLY